MTLTALLMVSLLGVTSVLIDGGAGFSARRQMQNAADAASLAGARALDQARFSAADPSLVDATARSVAQSNKADPNQVTCQVTDGNGTPIASCADTGIWMLNTAADGVLVTTAVTVPSTFAKAIKGGDLTARATATAGIRTVVGGDAPFMLCANSLKGGDSPSILLQDPITGGWYINPLAVGHTYNIHGPQVPDCGAGSNSFKGLANGPFVLPQWIPDSPGVRAGPSTSQVAGDTGCHDTVLNACILLVPLCVDGQGQGSSVQLYCVGFGAFQISQTSANKHTGTLLPGAIATSGQTSGNPGADSVREIKLIA
ncbi:MAG: hypothetical protein JO367_03670 [Actinobacteria bacterium]|nr:hypothetical protein [Actinomycetota bacterium]MBV8960180.1 hypothetical protein [Actinomycetota bacterium]MBV9933376.1 hypothetical protein [Actinomycetota bacterium]